MVEQEVRHEAALGERARLLADLVPETDVECIVSHADQVSKDLCVGLSNNQGDAMYVSIH